MGCLFTFLMVPFEAEKFSVLKFNISVLSLVVPALGGVPLNSFSLNF